MIAVWIIGVLFLIIGLILSIPTFIKFIKCKEHTTGKIVSIDNSSDKSARAVYEYVVANSKYTNRTNWTPHHIFLPSAESVTLFMIKIIQIILISSRVGNIFVAL